MFFLILFRGQVLVSFRDRLFVLLILSFTSFACSQRSKPLADYRDKPSLLIAETKIYDTELQSWITWPELTEKLRQNSFLLLGEQHDSLYHHILQATLIRAFFAGFLKTSVGFEQISEDKQVLMKELEATSNFDLDGIRKTLEWDSSGWPDWKIYEPVFKMALDTKSEIVALHLGVKDLELLREFEFEGDPKRWPFLEIAHSKASISRMKADLLAAHSFEVSDELLTAMLRIQNATDWKMARQLVVRKEKFDSKVVGIMGREHARFDRGVGFYLTHMGRKNFASICMFTHQEKFSSELSDSCHFLLYSP